MLELDIKMSFDLDKEELKVKMIEWFVDSKILDEVRT